MQQHAGWTDPSAFLRLYDDNLLNVSFWYKDVNVLVITEDMVTFKAVIKSQVQSVWMHLIKYNKQEESDWVCFLFQGSFSSTTQSAHWSLKWEFMAFFIMSEKAHSWLSLPWFALSFERWKALSRYFFAAHRRETLREPTRARQTFEQLHRRSHSMIPLLPPSRQHPPSVERRLGWGRPAFVDDPLTQCLSHCVWQRVAIQSEAFLASSRISVQQIAALHLACKMKMGAEALNELMLFVSNKLLMIGRHTNWAREEIKRAYCMCVLFPPLPVLDYKIHRLWASFSKTMTLGYFWSIFLRALLYFLCGSTFV